MSVSDIKDMVTSDSSSKTTGNRLQGKVAIVTGNKLTSVAGFTSLSLLRSSTDTYRCPYTGGGSGFGEGIAYRFASEGAKVVISDINSKGGERVAATDPSYISFVQADVTSASDWEMLVSGTISKYGRLDILVNNAGTSYKNKPTLEVTEREFDMVMNVNVKSVFLGTSAVVTKLLEQKQGGSIINIASVGVVRPRPGLVWYNASKGAVANVRYLQPDARCPGVLQP